MDESPINQATTDAETLEYVTPFALNINPSLIGIPLAQPWKRVIALGIDIALVTLISGVNGVFLAIVFSILFFYLGRKKDRQTSIFPSALSKRKRKLLRRVFILCGIAFILVPIAAVIAIFVNRDTIAELIPDEYSIDRFVELPELKTKYDKRFAESECETPECWDSFKADLEADIAEIGIGNEIGQAIITGYTRRIEQRVRDQQRIQGLAEIAIQDPGTQQEPQETDSPQAPSYSIIELGRGILEDFGLGFGWAALYFTLFISWWHGQTPGKKIMKLRVLQIDDTPISLWDSFGRCGGYAAGLSTGLLGFIQIFWDPNRQAIQDKISATVVVDLSKPRRQLK